MATNDVSKILTKIEILKNQGKDGEDYILDKFENGSYYGVNNRNKVVFALESDNEKLPPKMQKTRLLEFWFNQKCNLSLKQGNIETHMHVLICNSNDQLELSSFIRLTKIFTDNHKFLEQNDLYELFSALSRLFSTTAKRSPEELQGFFSELYLIIYLYNNGIDISNYWQKTEKEKFDFSISSIKRLEVKSTFKEERIHHFKHEQLITDLYEIVIASLILRKNDIGISIQDAIDTVRTIAADNFHVQSYIDGFIKTVSEEDLNNIKFDELYLIDNIRFINGEEVPKFSGNQPDGVSRTEYDSDLSNVKYLTLDNLRSWICE